MSELTLAIVFGVLSMLGYGLNNAVAKKPLSMVGPITGVVYRNFFIALLLLFVALFTGEMVWNVTWILATVAISFVWYIALLFLYKAFSVGEISVIDPVTKWSTVVAIFLAFFLGKFGILSEEVFTIPKILGIIGILIGILLISVNFKKIKSGHATAKGVGYALVTVFAWGIFFSFIAIPSQKIGGYFTAFILELSIFIFALIHVSLSNKEKIFPIHKKACGLFALIAFFGAMGTLMFTQGVALPDVSVVLAISAASPLVSLLAGTLFYKERRTLQEWFAAILILVSVVHLGFLGNPAYIEFLTHLL